MLRNVKHIFLNKFHHDKFDEFTRLTHDEATSEINLMVTIDNFRECHTCICHETEIIDSETKTLYQWYFLDGVGVSLAIMWDHMEDGFY